jgi:anion-transporting  ArsA/GET3 family ATPase
MEFFRSLANIEPGLRRRAGEVSKLLRSADSTFVVVSSPRSEAIGESEHLVDALRAGGFPFGGVVINLIHPLPAALDDDALREVGPGLLADQLGWYDDLRSLALAEREELAALVELAGDAPVVELALRDVDVHDVEGLGGLADDLVRR